MKTLFIILLLISQFAFAQQEVGQRSSVLAKARSDLEAVLERRSYTEEDQKIIKGYFVGVNSFKSDLASNSKYQKRFNQSVRASGVESFCGSVLLDLARWNSLVTNCTKNGFFLCSDEVMNFTAAKKGIAEKLESDLKVEFDKLDKCK